MKRFFEKSSHRWIVGILLAVCCIGMVVFFSMNGTSKKAVTEYVRQDSEQLDKIVQEIIDAGQVTENTAYRDYEIHYNVQSQMVEFRVKSSGIGSSTSYSGFYYSPSGEPMGFQGTDLTFVPDGAGWRWTEEGGDNWEYTEQITGNWYWFEVYF